MRIQDVSIKNFRLLKDIPCMTFHENSTVIVGRNNSGKTSLTTLFRRFLDKDSAPTFTIDDFSIEKHEEFWKAFLLFQQNPEELEKIRLILPKIVIRIIISYSLTEVDLGLLSEFIIDINPATTTAIAEISYEVNDGQIETLFNDIPYDKQLKNDIQKYNFYKKIKDRIPILFSARLIAIDPNEETNTKQLNLKMLRDLLRVNFINAQRGLDDETQKERDVLGKILSELFKTAQNETANEDEQSATKELDDAVEHIQGDINSDFNEKLKVILPALKLFGYPGLTDPNLCTETTLDVTRLLENHTKIRYKGALGISLPETYNGLGSRNLIYILFHIYKFYKTYLIAQPYPGIHLVFIEEPEAHLHPQMQEVFISQLNNISKVLSKELKMPAWPVQFVVTTHSTHIANRASFDSIRYFLTIKNATIIKDIMFGFTGETAVEDKDFLHKYLTLTKCDLFFADKAILIEGATERILLPSMINKIDEKQPIEIKLGSQYLSVVEVGGAYAHHFYRFLDFLELRTLIITDIDSVKKNTGETGKVTNVKCPISEGEISSNTGINKWFENIDVTIRDLQQKKNTEKIKGFRHISYQIPENDNESCGRSFEDAFMLANQSMFDIKGQTKNEKEQEAWNLAESKDISKTDFAIEYAITETTWNVPRYIKEGLEWLRENPNINNVEPSLNELEGSNE